MVDPLFCEMLKGPSRILNTLLAYISGFHSYLTLLLLIFFLEIHKAQKTQSIDPIKLPLWKL